MSTVKQILVLVVVLLVTNLATFAFATWRCSQELEGQQRLADAVSERAEKLERQLDAAEEELDRLSVWGDFIRLQQDLNTVDDQINRLNFGNAIDSIDAVAEEIRLGGYGELFAERRAELLPLLEEAKRQLRDKREVARRVLVEFKERAFEILSGGGSLEATPTTTDRDDEVTAPTDLEDRPQVPSPTTEDEETTQAPAEEPTTDESETAAESSDDNAAEETTDDTG